MLGDKLSHLLASVITGAPKYNSNGLLGEHYILHL